MKKILIIFLTLILCFLCACSSCSERYLSDGGYVSYYFCNDFKTEYTIEEHEEKIKKEIDFALGKKCEDVKIIYSLQEEPMFYVVRFYEKETKITTDYQTGEWYEEPDLESEDVENYGVGFINDEKYYLMRYGSTNSNMYKDVKVIFEEYRDKKVYYFHVCRFAYENEEGKKIYTDDNDEWFIKNKLGGQSEVKKKYYKKLRARVPGRPFMVTTNEVIASGKWTRVDPVAECGLVNEDDLPSSGCAG